MTRDDSRQVALDALLRIEDGAYAHILLPQLLRKSSLEPRDRALVTDLVYGTVRMQRAADHLLSSVATRPIDGLDPPVRAALRLGAYQLLAGIPPHAAVGETVGVVPERARGFANGVLRGLTRAGPPWKFPKGGDVWSVGVRTSHPDWIVQVLYDEFGSSDAIATLELDNVPPFVTLRPNPNRATPAALTAELRAAGVDVQSGMLVPDALQLRHAGDLAALPAISDGRATPQDQASQAIVAVLDPQPGERILDIASAPGGKATAAAELMAGNGLVVASDLHPGRVRTVTRAAQRLGLERAISAIVSDGRQLPVRDAQFDRVLLDAPCSGLGYFGAGPMRAGESAKKTSVTSRNCNGCSSRKRRVRSRPAAGSCTRSARSAGRRRSTSTPGPPNTFRRCTRNRYRRHPVARTRRGAVLLPSDAQTDGMFVLSLRRAVRSES